jgi:hypothetical protein
MTRTLGIRMRSLIRGPRSRLGSWGRCCRLICSYLSLGADLDLIAAARFNLRRLRSRVDWRAVFICRHRLFETIGYRDVG